MQKKLRIIICAVIVFSLSVCVLLLAGCKKKESGDGESIPSEDKKRTYEPITDTYEVMPDTWVFTDALGRTSLTYEDTGAVREDKNAAMFFWTWHTPERVGGKSYCNIQQYLDENPDITSYQNYSGWPDAEYYFWNEPVYGYYLSSDEWVARRQAELLASAGVDVVFTDNTNGGFTWKSGYTNLFSTWKKAQENGVNTPKISFMFPFGKDSNTSAQLSEIYPLIFDNPEYESLYFYLGDKPMVMGYATSLTSGSAEQKKIKSTLSFRRNYSAYFGDPERLNWWGWLSVYPQGISYNTEEDMKNGIAEETTAGVAANYNYVQNQLSAMNGYNVTGRSYTSSGYHTEEGASKYGYNFAEQFEYALEVDPRVIFITGWNEFIANRFDRWPEKYSTEISNAFPDEFNDEYSRDIEPAKGELADNYYYQLVNLIRRYKGVRDNPAAEGAKTIDITGDFSQWKDVKPYFAAYEGNTGDRECAGYGDNYYTEYSGRNDIIGAKVSYDSEYVYFIAECADEITPYTDDLWMVLYIDSDEGAQGWNTFDYVINKTSPSKDRAKLEAFTGNGYESTQVCEVNYTVSGHYLQLAVPKKELGIEDGGFRLSFAWTDNVHDEDDAAEKGDKDYRYTKFSGDIMNFYTSGDVAPGGRFKYCYDATGQEEGK